MAHPPGAAAVATLCTIACLAVRPGAAQAPSPGTSSGRYLNGVRSSDTTFRPRVRGSLVIDGAPGGWIARVAGLEAPSREAGDHWRFVFPDSQGELHVALPREGRALHGFWIQPPNPGGWFATPVALAIVWSPGPVLHGEIVPLEGDLAMDRAPAARPRPLAASPVTDRTPLPGGDGWQTASPSRVGLDDSLLVALVRRIAATDPAAPDAPLIHSLLVARHGKLVLDEYFFGFTSDQPHDLRSASKTFTGLMAGIAIDQGVLARDSRGQAQDPRRQRMTVAHLLTHTSGLACDDNDDASPGNEDRMQEQRQQPDWYRFTLELPIAHDPGTTYAYCSAGINLAGAVIAKAAGTSLLEFFDAYVAGPLEIHPWDMNLMPSGEAYAGGGLRLRPRDLLKLGQLFLDGGTWNGDRVVSKRWVEQSTSRQVDAPDGSADGYAWHLHTLQQGGRPWREYEASGNGGQFLVVLPELEMAVVFTAGNYNRYRIWRKFRDELIPQYIIGAVKDQRN